MQENMPTAQLVLLTGHGEPAAAPYGDRFDDERWPPLHCTLFITGAALACWGVLIGLATLILG